MKIAILCMHPTRDRVQCSIESMMVWNCREQSAVCAREAGPKDRKDSKISAFLGFNVVARFILIYGYDYGLQ